jgi:hypothetical protein
MKKRRNSIKLDTIKELKNGKLEGGFEPLSIIQSNSVYGGQTTNNCNGGNCVAGCGQGQNVVAKCGV